MDADQKASAERERQLESLCFTKCDKMERQGSLRNHKTAYNTLTKLGQPHRDNLRRLGYSFRPYEHRIFTHSEPKF